MNDTVLCQLNMESNIWNPKFIGPTLKCEGPMEGGLSVSQSVPPISQKRIFLIFCMNLRGLIFGGTKFFFQKSGFVTFLP